ncbi:hypothetical protein HJC23_012418 [Cyclotella cryptica]|uniref:Calponin-homology (CH) domain-containing protein n=1 Tax=Cyclotella cryptica TaxID=29204 RepID=A0ABD3Q1R3_9STRA|eukprot:CCRYP_009352-RA/>CCRYP_009352-RA protein AED:0.00 eAED:0.00 QI:172/0.8/0.83/1/0.8/0.5/6/1030/1930
MPTLIPEADENLDPNHNIPIANTKTNVNSLSPRRKKLSALPTERKAAMAIEKPQQKDQQLKPRFRENAPHVVGKRVQFHDTINHIGRSTTTNTVHPPTLRKLAHFARLYANSHNSASFALHDVDVSIQREFIHSTHRERKQSIAYSNYINYLLSPHGHRAVSELPPGVHSALLLHRQASTEMCAAKSLYDSGPMKTMRGVIDREVGRGRLTMRLDRDMDVWMQKELLRVFMSYGGRWLRLGLEVVLGKGGEQTTTNKHALEKIITQRILSDPMAIKKYTGGGRVKTPSGKYETTLRQILQHHAMTKMLTLVTFLDMAKSQNILSEDPCLFEKESRVKSSSQVLASICRICFARDEFILHHLAHLGIVVTHVQNPLEEYEFYVRNLASDLKDGVRLAKLAEMLTKRPVLSAMRLPATCRGHKMHNVGEALSALKQAGVENIDDVIPAHIVDAHQPRILQLLWGTIVHFQIGVLEEEVIQAEIDGICRWMEKRRAGGCGKATEGYHRVNGVTLMEEKGSRSFERIKTLLLSWCQTVCSFYDMPVENFTSSFSDGKILCLLISFYHPTLLPRREILPTLSDIQARVKQCINMNDAVVQMALQNEQFNLSLALNRMDALGGIPRLFSTKNFLLPPDENTVILCVSFLFSRLTETSQEIVASRVIQRWWHRSLLLRKRAAAARIVAQWRVCKDDYFRHQQSIFLSPVRVIESFYRRHEIRFKEMARHRAIKRKQDERAMQIQSIARMALASKLVRNKLLQQRASKLIQTHCRIFLAKKATLVMKMHKSSTLIQTAWRCSRIRLAYQFIRRGVKSFQSLWRSYYCRQQYEIILSKIIILQSALRRYLVFVRLSNAIASNLQSRSFFRQYLRWCNKKNCPCHHVNQQTDNATVQTLFRLVESRRMLNSEAIEFYSALHIQSIYLGFVSRRNMKTMGIASTQIQRIWRRYQAQLAYGFDLIDIIVAQSIGRRYLAQRFIKRMHDNTTAIQRIWRGYSEKVIYSFCLIEITTSQSIARRFIARRHFIRQLEASNIIQFFWRGHQSRKMYCHDLMSILKTQSVARRFIYQNSYTKKRAALILIQRTARKWFAMRSMTKAMNSATKIQAFFRAFKAKKLLGMNRAMAVTIQTYSRGVIARKAFRRIRTNNIMMLGRLCRIRHRLAALTIQKHSREWLLCRSHQKATLIQQVWGGHSDKQKYLNASMKIVAIQSQARKYIAGKKVAKLRSHSALQIGFENASGTTVQHIVNEGVKINSVLHESRHCIKANSVSKVHELSECPPLVFLLRSSSESLRDRHVFTGNDEVGNPSSETRDADDNREHGGTKLQKKNASEAPGEVVSIVNQVRMGDAIRCDDEIISSQPQSAPLEITSPPYNPDIFEIESSMSVRRESQNVLDVNIVGHSPGPFIEQDEMLGESEISSLVVVNFPQKVMPDNHVNTHRVNKRIQKAQVRARDDRPHCFSHEHVELNAHTNSVTPAGTSSFTIHNSHGNDMPIPDGSQYLNAGNSKHSVHEKVAMNNMNTVTSNHSAHEAHHMSQANSPFSVDHDLESEKPAAMFAYHAPNDDRRADFQPFNPDDTFFSTPTMTEINIQKMFEGMPSSELHIDIQVPERDSFGHEETFYSTQEDISASSMAGQEARSTLTQSPPLVSSKDQLKSINHAMGPDAFHTQGRNNADQYVSRKASFDHYRTKHQTLCEDSQGDQEIKSEGVQTRYKVAMVSALHCAESKADEKSYDLVTNPLRPTVKNSVLDVTTRSRSSSLDLECTHKALRLIETSRLLSDMKEGITILEHTTEHSNECRHYFTQMKGQNILCSLITYCNRSSPHLELIHMILKTLTNVAKHRSTAPQLAKKEVVEVIIYACQMYRDRSKLLALSSSLLEIILKNGNDDIMALYSTRDQKIRLHGVLSLCKKKASLNGSNLHLMHGIASLEHVLSMIDRFI